MIAKTVITSEVFIELSKKLYKALAFDQHKKTGQ